MKEKDTYQDKINSIKPSNSSVILELLPSGSYDVENGFLKLSINTAYVNLDLLPNLDRLLLAGETYPYESSKDLIVYREDKFSVSQKKVTCTNAFGQEFYYRNLISSSVRYLINLSHLSEIEDYYLKIEAEKAKKYFSSDEKNLNTRLAIKIIAHPVAPFYSSFSSDSGDSCPNSPVLRALADATGSTNTYFYDNHMINLSLDEYVIIDKLSKEVIYSIPFRN